MAGRRWELRRGISGHALPLNPLLDTDILATACATTRYWYIGHCQLGSAKPICHCGNIYAIYYVWHCLCHFYKIVIYRALPLCTIYILYMFYTILGVCRTFGPWKLSARWARIRTGQHKVRSLQQKIQIGAIIHIVIHALWTRIRGLQKFSYSPTHLQTHTEVSSSPLDVWLICFGTACACAIAYISLHLYCTSVCFGIACATARLWYFKFFKETPSLKFKYLLSISKDCKFQNAAKLAETYDNWWVFAGEKVWRLMIIDRSFAPQTLVRLWIQSAAAGELG